MWESTFIRLSGFTRRDKIGRRWQRTIGNGVEGAPDLVAGVAIKET
jgi:hypothetical protein